MGNLRNSHHRPIQYMMKSRYRCSLRSETQSAYKYLPLFWVALRMPSHVSTSSIPLIITVSQEELSGHSHSRDIDPVYLKRFSRRSQAAWSGEAGEGLDQIMP
jgi:hypothetical protein